VNASPVTRTSFLDTFLRLDTAYYYVVTSADAGGVEGNYSAEASVGR
jgi:fibronectin type 3 domain-containing protein